MSIREKYSKHVAVNVVISNMIGTGVFTSLGYQVGSIPSWFSILVLWFTGSIISLLGAFCYAEIATRIGRSGGEYQFLSTIYNPALGFIAGWISFIVGFSAPIAAVGLAIGEYTGSGINIEARTIATIIILLIGLVHLFGIKSSSVFQNIATRLKIILISLLILMPVLMYYLGDFSPTNLTLNPYNNGQNDWNLIFSSEFAISLVYVCFSYSGWNASIYFASKIDDPVRSIPYSVIIGTIVVSFMYLLLNSAFLFSVDMDRLSGHTDIGNLLIETLFPQHFNILSLFFGIALLATLSSMLISGPSVLATMGKDYRRLRFLNVENRFSAPYISIISLIIIPVFLLHTSSFEWLIKYIGVCLSFFSVLVVIGLPILRNKNNTNINVYKAPFGTIMAIVFSLINLWMIYHLISSDLKILSSAFITIFSGYVLYLFVRR